MSETKRILVAAALPPIVITPARPPRALRGNPLPRLGRLAWLLAALALPALGLPVVDLVHRDDGLRVTQAAASSSPSDGAAAHIGATPAIDLVRVAPQTAQRRDSRA